MQEVRQAAIRPPARALTARSASGHLTDLTEQIGFYLL
jgi:hypothetical protein